MAAAQISENPRYEPDEPCSHLEGVGVGLQVILLMVPGKVLFVALILGAAGQTEPYLSWAIFMTLAVAGVGTILQALRIKRFGAGHLVIMSVHPAHVPICIMALTTGGPSLMLSLIAASSLCQILLTPYMSLLRRIITPAVSGTLLMLVAAISVPPVFGLLENTSSFTAPTAYAAIIAAGTLITIVMLMLLVPQSWQLWTSLIGIAAGCLVAIPFGFYDFQVVREAAWVGFPEFAWPGIQAPGREFFTLLPAFIVVSLTLFIKSVGDTVAVQQVSWRRPRAADFRVIQGGLYANGVGGILSGLSGTIPSTGSATAVSIISITSVASTRVAMYIGVFFVLAACLPKIAAIMLGIPGFIMVSFMLIMIGFLFMEGVRTVVQEGIDRKKIIVVGVSFWIGVAFDGGYIYPELFQGLWSALLANGLASGGICAVLITLFIEFTSPRRSRLNTDLHISSLPKIDEFLVEFASRANWNETSVSRLRSVGEETLSIILTEDEDGGGDERRLIVTARFVENTAELEFLAASDEENLEDRLSYLSDQPETVDEREISFRLLRHYASSVQHRKYHNVDIVAVEVEGSR